MTAAPSGRALARGSETEPQDGTGHEVAASGHRDTVWSRVVGAWVRAPCARLGARAALETPTSGLQGCASECVRWPVGGEGTPRRGGRVIRGARGPGQSGRAGARGYDLSTRARRQRVEMGATGGSDSRLHGGRDRLRALGGGGASPWLVRTRGRRVGPWLRRTGALRVGARSGDRWARSRRARPMWGGPSC